MTSTKKTISPTHASAEPPVKLLYRLQKNELLGYHLYNRLAEIIKDEHNAKVLRQTADAELSHYEILAGFSDKKITLSPFRIRLARCLMTVAAKVLGLTFVLKYFERQESAAINDYNMESLAPEIKAFIKDEEAHEQMLIGMIDEERLKYTGSIVLGLNDALVELTGALAGFTLSLQNARTIALLGLITGISASFSMAASEYLSTKAEENAEVSAKKASLYTGIAYVITVVLLILPFLLISNYIVSLAVTISIAICIIALFNYYISVARDGKFRRRFFEMAAISIGVAAVSFLIGYLVKTFIGIDL